jgi:hypothetical protein
MMKQFSADAKHHILLEYRAHSPTHSFAALAAAHGVEGGEQTVRKWHARWNGTAQSLEHKAGSGRPRVLSKTQVKLHVAAPIRNSNRAARVVRYSKLLPQVQANSGKNLSLRTLQRYGHDEAGARQTRGKKRTAEERECTETSRSGTCSVCPERHGVELTRPRMPTCSVCEHV